MDVGQGSTWVKKKLLEKLFFHGWNVALFGFLFVYTASNCHRGVDVWDKSYPFFYYWFFRIYKPLYSVIYLDMAKLDFRGTKYNNW